MAIVAAVQVKIVKNGGPVTSDLYKAYYSGTAAYDTIRKGEVCFLDATGYICRADHTIGAGTYGTASAITTASTTTPFGAARRWFVCLEDHLAASYTAADYISVQEILNDTVLELQVCASGTTQPLAASMVAGATYGAYTSTTGVWGIDIDGSSNGFLVVQDKDSDTKWFLSDPGVVSTTPGLYVRAKLAQSILL